MARTSDSSSTDRGVSPKLVLAVLLGVLFLVFIAENTRSVPIRFIVPKVDSPLWVALLVAAAIGFVAGWLFAHLRRER